MANKTISVNGTTWTGTAKADKVYIDADYVKVNTGAGNDSIKNRYNYAWYSTINAGDGNDTITFDTARKSSINAGAGNDKISLSGGYYLTIRGGKGNDTVYAAASYNLYQYASGDGNDVIYNWGAGDTISITGGTYTKKTSGSDVILTVGEGKITLVGAKDKAFTIKGTLASGGKNINNTKAKKLLTGTSYADTIKNSANYVTISGGKGNDKIDNQYANNSSIVAGDGNDTISNFGAKAKIYGGNGNDSIFNDVEGSIESGSKITVFGGAGDDTIRSDSAYSTLDGGDNNDNIINFGWDSSLNGGNGNDYIENLCFFNDEGSKVTISGGAGNDSIHNWGGNVSISAGAGKDFIATSTGKKVTIDCGDGNDTVHNWSERAFIRGGAGNDDIMNGSNVKADYSTVDGGDGDDTISNYSNSGSIFGGKGNDFISSGGYYDCNKSTIKGGAGNDTVSLNSGSGYNVIQYTKGDGNDLIYGVGSTDTISITGAKYTRSTVGNDVVLMVGEGAITLKDAKGKKLNIKGTLASKTLSIPTNALKYNGHSYYIFNNALTWEQAQAYCESRGGHLAVINNAAENTKLFNYMKSKGYNSAYFGLSDAVKEGTWTWANGNKVSYKNWASGEPNGGTYENYGMFYYKYNNGKWNDGDFSAGSSFYLDGKLIKDTNAFICEWDTVSGSTSTVEPAPTVPPAPSGDVLKGTNGHDNIGNGISNYRRPLDAGKIIYGYDGNDTITNYANNVYISGGKGNDYIKSNYGSNSTILGGAGADNITVESNNALIYGEDGNDKIITYNEGNFIYGGKGNDSINTRYNNNGFVSGDAGDDTITAYKGTHLTLSGGAGNDYLWGGVNSDTLIGGSGDDIFVYKPGEGTDHITDFSGGDMLKILKSNGSAGGTFTSATYQGDSLTLAISGGGSVILDNVKAGQSININGVVRTISGKTLK